MVGSIESNYSIKDFISIVFIIYHILSTNYYLLPYESS